MTAWLTDTLLYTGLLIALVLLLRRPVSRYFGPRSAYTLWILPALRLLLPPVVLPASLAPQQPHLSDSSLLALATASDASPVPMPAPPPSWERGDLWLALWLGGAALLLAWRIHGYLRMRRDLLAEAHPVGEVGRIRLIETPAISSPVAFGVFDKVVALPPGFIAMKDRLARDLAIAHELAHHRGHDIAANFAAQPLLALHWFNPLAWLGWRAMRRDQEAACDARVLQGRGREERAAYAALIAGLAAGSRPILGRRALAAPMACPIVGEKSIIHRLRSLSMSDVSPSRRRLGRLLLAGGALALPLTASVSYAAAQAGGVDATEVPAPAAKPASPVSPTPPVPPAPPRAAAAPHAPAGRRIEGRSVVLNDGGQLTAERKQQLKDMRKQWGKNGADWQKMAANREQIAVAMADARENIPDVSTDCDKADGQSSRSWIDDKGRPHVVICERAIREQARMAQDQARLGHDQALRSLKRARAAIAGNDAIGSSVRDEVIRDLDKEIARLDVRN